jgi:predicted NAD/FAD-dependent oxidoreductase
VRIAVIGAGLAGLTCARALHDAELDVVVLEKARGTGGRTATRRAGAMAFDHGAPAVVAGALGAGGVRWRPQLRGGGRLDGYDVAPGAMSAAARGLATGLDVRTGTRVAPLPADPRALAREDGRELGRFDRVVVCVPAPQAAVLLAACDPDLAARAARVSFAPCWAVMAAWDEPLGVPWEAARPAGILAWAVSEAAKPGRAPGERWVLQAGAPWSTTHLADTPEAVTRDLLAAFGALTGLSGLPAPAHAAAHRWRYAVPATPLGDRVLARGPVVVAGDWCGGTDAGAARASGRAAAAVVLAS